ncbi:MAG TPA: PA0069 family radical SAM protein [Candidatus Binatia bacterium]|nr:PA0069 family radical SAM protein [Candidatus Binatia bacterium]
MFRSIFADMEKPAAKGRGAVTNRSGRFESIAVEDFDDGWGRDNEERSSPRTIVFEDRARTIINSNDSPDVPFDRSVNPYRGCEHGCIYCFARPSHTYLGLSAGLDFETKIYAKHDAAALLRAQLSARRYQPRVIVVGANTDPYQPVEARLGLTRSVLQVLSEFSHPVAMITKSSLVLRDLDVLAPMAERRLAQVSVSVTTLDPELARVMEPRASAPSRRIEAIRRLSQAGIPVAALAAPMIPGLNDWEMDRILEAAREAGAVTAGYVLLRLPLEIADLFTEWLYAHFPARARRVLDLMRQSHDGKLYRSEFGTRMHGSGPYADMLEKRFDAAAARLGFSERGFKLDTSQFKVPRAQQAQLGLFET